MSATYYFDGDCTNASVVAEIKSKFIATLSNSKYRDACQIHAKERSGNSHFSSRLIHFILS